MAFFKKATSPPVSYNCPTCGVLLKKHCAASNNACDVYVCDACNEFGTVRGKLRWTSRVPPESAI